jgi:hypothetical protein
MQFAADYRESALALLKDLKAPVDPLAHLWLRLAVVEDQLVLWAAQIEKESRNVPLGHL